MSKQALLDQRSRAFQALSSILDTAETENRDLTAEDRKRYTALEAEVDALTRAIELTTNQAMPGNSFTPAWSPNDDLFDQYLRGKVSDAELRAQGVGTASAGGYLVPQGFRQTVTETRKAIGQVRRVAEVIQTDTGAALPWPTNNDTSNTGALLAENTQASELDLTLGTKQLDAYKYTSGLVRVSIELLQDAGFDVAEFIGRKLGQRIGRIQNTHFTTGTGSSQPNGIVTGATSAVTAAGVATVTMDELIDLQESIDPDYLEPPGDVGWMMSQAALKVVRKLKDSDGLYLWQPSNQIGVPSTLLGAPVYINNDMAAPATGVKSILYGNFRAGYVIRDTKEVSVLRLVERYADYGQEAFIGWARADGEVQYSAAYKALTQA